MKTPISAARTLLPFTVQSRSVLRAALFLTAATFTARPTFAAPGWYGATGGFISNIAGNTLTVPDFYQHQNWFTNGAAPEINPTNGWETNNGLTNGGAAGWCNYTAYADIFYDFYARGITSIYPNANVNPITNPYNALYGPSSTPANVANSDIYQIRAAMGGGTGLKNVQDYLKTQNTGLVSNSLIVANAGANLGVVQYNDPATGTLKPIGSIQSFRATNLLIQHLNANMVYTLLPGTASQVPNAKKQNLWWDFHNVAVAGLNTTTSTVFVADPDTNKGPTLDYAGWPVDVTFPALFPTPGGGAVLTSAVGSARPVPAAPNTANAATYNTFYDAFNFGGARPANAITSSDAPQFNGTLIKSIDFVCVNPKKNIFGNFKLAANNVPAFQTTLTLNLPDGADTVNGIFIEPTSTLLNPSTDSSFFSVTSPSATWSPGTVSTVDPFNNSLTYGGVEFDLLSGTPLTPGVDALVNLGTLADFSTTGYNILLHFTGDATDTWLPIMEGGSLFNPSATATDQFKASAVPEPASLALAAICSLTLLRRRRPEYSL